MSLCKCGCGNEVEKRGKKYYKDHYRNPPKKEEFVVLDETPKKAAFYTNAHVIGHRLIAAAIKFKRSKTAAEMKALKNKRIKRQVDENGDLVVPEEGDEHFAHITYH